MIALTNTTDSSRAEILANKDGSGGATYLALGTRNSSGTTLERLRITSAGLVGIGTTGPGELLSINNSSSNAAISIRTGGASFNSVVKFNADDTNYAGIGIENTALVMRCSNSATPTERARIDSSGRLLVGTTPAQTFAGLSSGAGIQCGANNDYAGIAIVSSIPSASYPSHLTFTKTRGTTTSSRTIVNNGDQIGLISFQGTDGSDFIRLAGISAEVDGTPGTNDMPGRLVFSTTADGASSPTERMRIAQLGLLYLQSTDDAIRASTTQGSGTSFAVFRGYHSGTANVSGMGTNTSIIWSNGNVQNTNNSYGAISDIKLKENIVDATSQWSDIKALQVRKYNFKEDQTHTQIGLVAQEVELVSPGLVSESPDRDAEGNDLGTVTKSVNYSVLYMKAVKALQEAMDRIETLEVSNADILARLSALEGK